MRCAFCERDESEDRIGRLRIAVEWTREQSARLRSCSLALCVRARMHRALHARAVIKRALRRRRRMLRKRKRLRTGIFPFPHIATTAPYRSLLRPALFSSQHAALGNS